MSSIVPLLNGCLGGAVIQRSAMSDDSNIALKDERGYIVNKVHGVEYSKQEVLQLWGPPYAKDLEGETEAWRYHREIAFSGLMLVVVVVPVPLLVPVGYRDTILFFSNDKLVKAVREYGGGTGFFCAVVQDFVNPPPPGQFSHPVCRIVRPQPPKEWTR
jgi:hypothetical protein